jgi:hypothetical protein
MVRRRLKTKRWRRWKQRTWRSNYRGIKMYQFILDLSYKNSKMKNLSQFILVIYFSCSFNIVKAQTYNWGDDELPKEAAVLSIKVNYIDSFYVLNATLKVTGKEIIFLQKDIKFKDFFSRKIFEVADADATMFLSKAVMNSFMIWAPDEKNILYGLMFDSNGNRVRTTSKIIGLKTTGSITGNFKLNNIYPLDLGYYKLFARVRVKYKSKYYYVYSDELYFEVDKLPSQSAAFHN